MKRSEIIEAFRDRTHDTEKPYLWSDLELREYLEDAINEACERANLLRDTETPDICQISVVAGTASYPLDDRILAVLRAKLDTGYRPLCLTTIEALDLDWRGWEDETAGDPTTAAIDQQASAWVLRLVPPPETDTVLRLQVYRLPLEPLENDKCEPEIHRRLHIKLLDWMVYRAYSKDDAETRDDKKAAAGAEAFAATFGPKRDTKTIMAQHDMQHPVVRPHGL